ncbi:HlyD family efflux transporter periplasmic adaptor subunit [Viscerimonas tarda]
MENIKPLYTEEFKEVLQKVPNKYNAFITIGLLLFFMLLLLLGFLIKVPGKTEALARITSINPPIILKAHSSGKIIFLVDSFPIACKAKEYIAMINNPASPKDIQYVKELLNDLDLSNNENIIEHFFTNQLSLGYIENSYFKFISSLQEYYSLKKDSRYEFEIKLLAAKINNDSLMLEQKMKILENNKKEYSIIIERTSVDSVLFSQNAILKDEYTRTLLSRIDAENKITSLTIDVYNVKQNIIDTKLQKQKVEIEFERTLKNAQLNLLDALQNLHTSINEWENNYAFFSSEKDGIVELIDFVSNGDFVNEGQALFDVVFEGNSYHGIAILAPDGAGEVKRGQKVNIKLDLYPYQEYGTLDGYVTFITKNSIENNYLVNISLEKGLMSTNNIELAFAETMSGQAEIITEDRRLIEVVFYKIKKMLTPDTNLKKDATDEENNKKQY